MVRRSRLEIYFDVLDVVDKGTSKPTRIMYRTNLSWTTLQSVIDTLIDSDFLKEERDNSFKRYFITKKGKNALSYHMKSVEGLLHRE